MGKCLVICLLLVSSITCFPQNKFTYGVGIAWQSTVMNFFNFKPIPTFSYYMPYNYERNIQGLGLQAVLTYQVANQWAFSYVPTLRYDDLEINPDTIPGNYRQGLIVNHQFSILRSLGIKNKFNRNYKIGIGYSLFNSFNKAIKFYDPVYQIHFSIPLRFPAITIRYDIPLGKKLLLFPTANIIYKNFPNDPVPGNRRYAFYTVSVLYTAGR
jgi:hypothetical protein